MNVVSFHQTDIILVLCVGIDMTVGVLDIVLMIAGVYGMICWVGEHGYSWILEFRSHMIDSPQLVRGPSMTMTMTMPMPMPMTRMVYTIVVVC